MTAQKFTSCALQQGAAVDGPVPAPFLAPAISKEEAPALAPTPSQDIPDTPLSFLIKGITDIADAGRPCDSCELLYSLYTLLI